MIEPRIGGDGGMGLAAVRMLFGLATVFKAADYAQRPPCGWCGQSVTGRSFVHNAVEGCIHDKCRKERARFMQVWQSIDTPRADAL